MRIEIEIDVRVFPIFCALDMTYCNQLMNRFQESVFIKQQQHNETKKSLDEMNLRLLCMYVCDIMNVECVRWHALVCLNISVFVCMFDTLTIQ